MKNYLLLTICFIMSSCKYQNADKMFSVEPAEVFEQSQTTLEADSFEDIFQEYLERYVVVLDQTKYDTRVDYKKIAADKRNQNPEYMRISGEINSYIGSSAYDGLSLDGKIALLIFYG